MEKAIAIEAIGSMRNTNELILSTGVVDKRSGALTCYDYPLGRAIRGFFGYFFLDMGSKLVETFNGEEHNAIYFKDALPYHHIDQGLYSPKLSREHIVYECEKCKQTTNRPTWKSIIIKTKQDRLRGVVSQMFKVEAITKPSLYRFKTILNLKTGREYLPDFLAALNYAVENGIRIGKRNMKGNGVIELKNIQYNVITNEMIKERAEELQDLSIISIKLLSDAIIKEADWNQNKIEPEAFLKSVKNAAKFFNPEYKSYADPEVKLQSYITIKPTQQTFLDYKNNRANLIKEYVIPRGAIFTYEVKKASIEFWEALAIAERCKGIGKRTSFGMGEFKII
jgi:hypothetical protein